MVQIVPIGATTGRVIAKLTGPVDAAPVTIPGDTRPGRYTVQVVAMGDGLRDAASVPLVVPPTGVISGGPSVLSAVRGPGRSIIVNFSTAGRGNVQVIRRGATSGPVIRKFTGPVSGFRVVLPSGLAKARYRVLVVAIGKNGRAQVTIPFTITRTP